jgi:hypothetical protein
MSSASLKLLFNLLALGVAICLAFALCLGLGHEDLLLRHLAEGRLIASQGGFPLSDPFSYSLPLSLGFDKNGWLFSLAVYGLHQFAGMKSLSVLHSAVLLAVFALLLGCGFRRGARPFSSALFSLAALIAILPDAALSPALAGLPFFCAAIFIMEGEFWPAFFARWIWLPALMVVWVNLDAGALVLIPMAGIWAFAERSSLSPQKPQFPVFALLSTLGVVTGSAFLHPALWKIFSSVVPGPLSSPLDPDCFENARFALGFLSLACLFLLASVALPQGREHARRDLLLFFGFVSAALLWRASLPYACLFAAPMAAARADQIIDALPDPLRQGRWFIKIMALGAALFFLPRLLASATERAQAIPRPQPKESLEFFDEELLSGNVFNENDWAGLLLWKLSPALKVFSDGERGAASDYVEVMNGSEGWENILQRYSTDFAWLRINSPLAKLMARSAAWQPIDFDDASVLYVSVNPAHADLIKTWAPRGLRPGDMDDPFDASRLPQVEADLEMRRLKRPNSGILHYYEAKLGEERGEDVLARQWLEQGIKADPDFAPNYRFLGELRLKAGDKKGAESFFERAAAMGDL